MVSLAWLEPFSCENGLSLCEPGERSHEISALFLLWSYYLLCEPKGAKKDYRIWLCKVNIKVIAIVTIQWDMFFFPYLLFFYVKWKSKIVCLFCNCVFSFAKWSPVSGCEPEWPFGACERLCLWEVCEVFTWFLHQQGMKPCETSALGGNSNNRTHLDKRVFIKYWRSPADEIKKL